MPDMTPTPAQRAAQTPFPCAQLSQLIAEAFGDQGEDVITPIGEAGRTCRWLLDLFLIIQAEVSKHDKADLSRILSIAGVNQSIAGENGGEQ